MAYATDPEDTWACYCTGPAENKPDVTAYSCCATDLGITFTDGNKYLGDWRDDKKWCVYKTKAGKFSEVNVINSMSPCCKTTGDRASDKDRTPLLWGGNCFLQPPASTSLADVYWLCSNTSMHAIH